MEDISPRYDHGEYGEEMEMEMETETVRGLAQIAVRMIGRTKQMTNPHRDHVINFNYENATSLRAPVRAYRRLPWSKRDNRWSDERREDDDSPVSELKAVVEWLEVEAARPTVIGPCVSDGLRFLVIPLVEDHAPISRILISFGLVSALDKVAARYPYLDGELVEESLNCSWGFLQAERALLADLPRACQAGVGGEHVQVRARRRINHRDSRSRSAICCCPPLL